jgi:hypothetical protein
MYRCIECGTTSEDVVLAWDPRFAKGKCSNCDFKTRTFTRDSVEEGKNLKTKGQEQAEGHTPKWSDLARQWIERKIPGVTYTSEDITAELGQPPSSGAVGAVMTGAAKSSLHRKYRLVKAERPNQHAAEIWEWIRI